MLERRLVIGSATPPDGLGDEVARPPKLAPKFWELVDIDMDGVVLIFTVELPIPNVVIKVLLLVASEDVLG